MQVMKEVKVLRNQTIYDLAVQHYGTLEALSEIINNNPTLLNDKEALSAAGIDYFKDDEFYFDIPIAVGFALKIDTDSFLLKKTITQEMTEVTTYNTENNGKND